MLKRWAAVVLGAVCATACGSSLHLPPTPAATATPSPLCGPGGDWTSDALAGAALPAGAMPSPLALEGSRAEGASALQLQSPSPSGSVVAAFVGGYRRDWVAGGKGAAFIELWAFDTETAAQAWQDQLGGFVAAHGVSASAAALPGGVEFQTHGPGGDGYGILTERTKVVMELGAGGPGITQSTVEDLARTQYDRLCRS